MLRRVVVSACGLILLAAPLIASAQTPSGTPAPVERPGIVVLNRTGGSPAGVIRGQVLSAGTGRPLRRALVAIASAGSAVAQRLVTDIDGRFDAELPPGRYSIAAQHQGYAPLAFGQAPGDAPRLLTLREAAIEQLTLRLLRNGAIEAQVVDEFGDPIAGATVTALPAAGRTGGAQPGLPALTGVTFNLVRTDDRGRLRLFDLAPGEYLVRAELPAALNIALTFGGAAPPGQEGYVPTYYPGTASPEAAAVIAVAAGQDVQGVTIQLVRLRVATVSGRIVRDSAALRASAEGFTVRVSAGANRVGNPVFTSGDTFTIPGLPPGAYRIDVSPRTGGMPASTTVAVDGVDITDLVLGFPDRTARGRVEFEDGTPPASLRPDQVRVRGSGAVVTVSSTEPSVRPVRDDWTFEVTGLTGTRRLVVSAPPPWRLARILHAGRDVSDEELDFSNDVAGLTLVLTSRASDVSGFVTDARGERLRSYTVVIFLEDRSRWTAQSRYIATAGADQDGRYLVRGLPAGRYIAVAVERHTRGNEYDPNRLDELRSDGLSFTLGEYENRALDLRMSTR